MTDRATHVLDAGALHATPRDLLEDIFGWDVITFAPALEHWQRYVTADLTRSTALEVGAGQSGGLSLWLALQGCDVVCSTLGEVSPRVRALHRRYGVGHRVRYANIDVLAFDEREAFDVIAFKSILGGIGANGHAERQRDAIQRLHAALKPGGNLLFAENVAATRIHAAARARFGAGKDGWRYPTTRELSALLRPFASVQGRTAGFLGTWGSSELQRRASGRVDAFLCRWLVPASWQYAMMGVAIK
jgi:SAM-dependent methyltransferase